MKKFEERKVLIISQSPPTEIEKNRIDGFSDDGWMVTDVIPYGDRYLAVMKATNVGK